MIQTKTPEEVALMREGGAKLSSILQKLLDASIPGAILLDIERLANELIAASGGTASFKTVPGYKWATCLNVNEVVVHGIPTAYKLKEGDMFTIDVGLLYKGFHTDTAWTKIINGKDDLFLTTGKLALERGIKSAKIGNRVGHISKVIQETIEGAGFSIVKSLVGHGVGLELHEEPQVPNFLRGDIENTPLLVEGMTLALEPIYAQGRGEIVYENDDGWTLATRDRSKTAVFEHSIAISRLGPVILTEGLK